MQIGVTISDVNCRILYVNAADAKMHGYKPEEPVYIGEAENIRDRVKAHLEKDFWNQLIYFISKDENLTKAHILFLRRQAHRPITPSGPLTGHKRTKYQCEVT